MLGLPCSVPLHMTGNKLTVVGRMGVLGQTSPPLPILPQALYTGGKIIFHTWFTMILLNCPDTLEPSNPPAVAFQIAGIT